MSKIIASALLAVSIVSVASVAARADYFGNDSRTLNGQHFTDKVFTDAEKNGI